MKRILFLAAWILVSLSVRAQEFIPLWPEGRMPNSKGVPVKDSVDNARMRQVGTPGFYIFLPSKEENKGAAVLICPPGGYSHLTYDIAGFQLAKWFNTMGISAFVLMHRLPHSPDLVDRSTGPLMDGQRALKIIRSRAAEWGIDPERIGAMGSSAGGHLAATLATYPEDLVCIDDGLDAYGIRPDFLVLVSPVITMGEYAHQGSRRMLLGESPSQEQLDLFSCEKQVAGDTPPTFLMHADNDRTVSSMNSLLFYQAMKNAGASASLHIFPDGGHSIALRNNPGSTQWWTTLCESWLYEMKLME